MSEMCRFTTLYFKPRLLGRGFFVAEPKKKNAPPRRVAASPDTAASVVGRSGGIYFDITS
jgi:hypothetical protein